MTIASKLETINEALGDIKSSIVAKGVTPTGDITTFSTAIDNVPTPDTWYNWKNTEYTPNFSMNGTVSINDRILTSIGTNAGVNNIYYEFANSLSTSSTYEICLKVKFDKFPTTDQSLAIFSLGCSSADKWGNSNVLQVAQMGKYLFWKSGGSGVAVLGSVAPTSNTWYWFKFEYHNDGVGYSYLSTNGTTWTSIGNTAMTLSFRNKGLVVGVYRPDSNCQYDLPECYVKVNGETVWTPYTESSSQCYTLTASPTTSTQVYEIPKKTSALTITAVGTGTITLSDSKVYNRNSAGDVQSPVLGTKSIDTNGTYTAASDYLDGFSSVTVDVPGITREVSAQGVYQMPASSFTFSLPSNATDVGERALYNAFYNCTALTSVDLSSLTKVSGSIAFDSAFYNCTGLTSVDLSSLKTVSGISGFYNAFYQCAELTSVDLSSLLSVSGRDAFSNAFRYCISLTSISFPSLVSILGSNAFTSAFGNCTNIESISFPSLRTISFGSTYKNQFSNMLSNTGTAKTHTLHFPSNLQTTISGLTGYPNFGGTDGYVTCLFDLPATS